MEDKNEVPILLEFLFGQAAQTAQRGASPRLIRWAAAFDEWIAERGRVYKPGTTNHARRTWRRLLRERCLMPWELDQEHIEQHVAWMQAQGFAANTIYNALGTIAQFYRWCDERQIDPQCEPGFNPAAGVVRTRVKIYAQAQLLSRGELSALLGILQQDDSPLGKRDYAFTLARVRMGVPLKALQQLQWGQIELHEDGVPHIPSLSRISLICPIKRQSRSAGDRLAGRDNIWVRLRPGAKRIPLPVEVWGAIRAYLAAAGRLAGIRPGDYIFAPLAAAVKAGENNAAQDWARERCLSNDQILASLKLYGRLVKIPERKLTMRALRRTAVRLRLDQGAPLEELSTFLDSRENPSSTRYRLGSCQRRTRGLKS